MKRRSDALGVALAASPLLLAVTFLGRAGQNAGQTTFPLIGREVLGMDSFAIGGMVAAAGAASVFCSTAVIGRARRWSPAALLAAGQILALGSFVLMVVPAGRPGLWLGAVSLGAASGLVFPSLMTVVATASAGRRAKALALMSVALSASLVTGPLVEAGVLRVLGNSLRAALAAMMVFPLGASLLAVRWARRAPLAALVVPAGSGAEHPATGQAGLGPTFRLALTVMLTYEVPFAVLIAFGALLARHALGASAAEAEIAFGVFFAASAVVRLTLTVVAPGRHLGSVLITSAVLTAVGVGALGVSRSFWELAVGMAVLGVPHGTTFPLASTILAEFGHADERELVRANGRLMAGTNGAAILVPLVYGWIAARLGYRAMFLLIEVPVLPAAGWLIAQILSARSPLRQPAGAGDAAQPAG